MSRLARIVTLSLVGLAIVAGPAAPAVQGGVLDYGAIAECQYAVTDSGQYGWTEALLKKIVVNRPTMPKTDRSQTVGWRFVVERSLDRENTPWRVIYRSRLQRALKTALFTTMRVGVTVPPDSATPNGQRYVWYRVTIKMFWFGPDGSVQKKIVHLMENLNQMVDGEAVLTDIYCPGRALQFIDGGLK